MWADAALVLGAYLLGSAPHLVWLARLRRVKLTGDFHEGLYDRGGRAMGGVGVLGEFIKGALPVLAGKALGFSLAVVALAGLAAVAGQMWPVFSRFDGEKGNSIGIAMAAALAPLPILAAVVPAAIAVTVRTVGRLRHGGRIFGGAPSRSLPLGMLATFLVFPLTAWGLGGPREAVWGGVALWVMIVSRRLTAGLGVDLKAAKNPWAVLRDRLLYDRSTAAWRR
jgi:glycerol-3-phosphate acyltransferase PlsY